MSHASKIIDLHRQFPHANTCCVVDRRRGRPNNPPGRSHQLSAFLQPSNVYGLNQLRYDLRKLKGHGLVEREGSRYDLAPG
jgi:hypothetical protein